MSQLVLGLRALTHWFTATIAGRRASFGVCFLCPSVVYCGLIWIALRVFCPHLGCLICVDALGLLPLWGPSFAGGCFRFGIHPFDWSWTWQKWPPVRVFWCS